MNLYLLAAVSAANVGALIALLATLVYVWIWQRRQR